MNLADQLTKGFDLKVLTFVKLFLYALVLSCDSLQNHVSQERTKQAMEMFEMFLLFPIHHIH